MVSTVEGERALADLVATGVAEDPYPAYALLRQRGAVSFLAARSLWIVAGYEECRAVLRDSARFPAWNGSSFFTPGQPPAMSAADPPHPAGSDDRDARQQRRQCAYHALSPRARGAALEPTMREIANDLVAALPHGRNDLMSGLVAPFAEATLAAYFGLPQPAWRDYLSRWLADLRPADGRPRAMTGPVTEMIRAATLRRARTAFEQVLQDELDRRRLAPRDDVLGTLAHAADSHDAFADQESLRIVPTLANNAYLGLSDLAGTVLWHLLATPSLAVTVAADERLLAGAIEEILRLDPPVQAVPRRAAVAVTLGGERIPAGAPVLVLLAAANRDPAVFPDPERLDPRRSNAADHLSFGHGTDFCIGAPLVRRAVTVLTRAVLARLGHIRLPDDAEIRHWPNPFNRGLQRLDVVISEEIMTTALSTRDVRAIVARASTLYERLAWPHVPPEQPADRTAIDRRLERWRQTAAAGDPERFAARLARDGLDAESVRPYLASTFDGLELPLPPWAKTLRAMVEAALAAGPVDRATCRFLDPADPVAFEDALAPFVRWASDGVARRAGDAIELLDDHARGVFEAVLLRLLAFQLARTLQVEFAAFRFSRQSSWERLVAQLQGNPGRAHYEAFTRELLAGGIVRVIRDNSAAARRAAMLTDAWIATTAELLRRLAADREEIAATFNGGIDPGPVVDVEAELSDRHNGGHTVAILTFASGLRVVYKPKRLDTEVAYDGLLAWMNAHGAPLPLTRLALLPRDGYGWVEFASHAPVANTDAAARFFQRLGALTCVVVALQGNDCHHENIIAAGEQPVLVDTETLLHPQPSARVLRSDRDVRALAYRRLWGSVAGTGILPRWSSALDGAGYDISALGGVPGQEIHVERPQWVRINTDAMDVEPVFVTSDSATNLPTLNDQPLDPAAYRDEFLAGFEATYRWFLAVKPALLAADGPLRPFAGLPVRVILRPTQTYALLMRKITHPDYAADGIDASIEWDLLARSFAGDDPFGWPLHHAEHRAMAACDVPFFVTRADSTAIEAGDGRQVGGFFDTPGYERALAAIAAFDDEDMVWQLGLIRTAFQIRFAGEERSASDGAADDGFDRIEPLPAAELVAAAQTIAARLARQAIESTWGAATWVGPHYDAQTKRHALEPLGTSLYDGTAGIALFLAALERQTDGAGYRDLALAALQPLRGAVPRTASLPLGGLIGLGSAIYALLQTGLLLDDGGLIDDAVRVVALVTDERIAADDRLDLLSGAAGALLALLAVHARTGSTLALDRAVACGHHLLAKRRPDPAGHLAWPTLDGQMLAGLSHGAAGIAYALQKLAAQTGDEAFLAAAREGIAHERTLFSPDDGNWHSYVETAPAGARALKTSWCHGAAGMGLARLAALPVHDTPGIRDEIAVALATTRAFGQDDVDHLCCGHAGRAEVLLDAGRRLGRPDLVTDAARRAAWLVARATEPDGFRLFHGQPAGGDSPGLFQGIAGIGYTLLRVADGDASLPSVLLLDA